MNASRVKRGKRPCHVGAKATANTAESATLAARALQLRCEGWTLQAIAKEIGRSTGWTSEAIHAEITRIPKEDADALRRVEGAKLDDREQRCRAVMSAVDGVLQRHAENVAAAFGTAEGEDVDVVSLVKRISASDESVLDASRSFFDGDRTLSKIAERRAKLLGLDAPTKTEVTGKDGAPLGLESLTTEQLAQRARELADKLAGQK